MTVNVSRPVDSMLRQPSKHLLTGYLGVGEPLPLTGVTVTAEGSNPRPIDYFGGYLWGRVGTDVYRSADMGTTWGSPVFTTPANITGIVPTSDGEVLILAGGTAGGVWKSTGFAELNPTWTKKASPDGGSTATFLRWGFDGDGTKFIVTEYSGTWADSRLVQISLDAGDTWFTAWDTAEEFPDSHTGSHLHAVCYDPWEDRFWFTEGHGTPRGFYFSDDDGASWTKLVQDLDLNSAPTTLTATDHGIVVGSDSTPGGVYVIGRKQDSSQLNVQQSWTWRRRRGGLIGFADRGMRDPDTGIVYVSFRSNFSDVPMIIVASNGIRSELVYSRASVGAGDRIYSAIAAQGKIAGYVSSDGNKHLYGVTNGLGGVSPNTYDTGRMLGGVTGNTSIAQTAAGLQSTTNNAQHTTVVGSFAQMAGNDSGTAIGSSAKSENYGVAIGRDAETLGVDGVAIGPSSQAQVRSIAIGRDAKALGSTQTIVIGWQAECTQSESVVIGSGAFSSIGTSVAIGQSANVTGVRGVAIGAISQCTVTQSVAVGYNARATGNQTCVALGHSALASGNRSIAIGDNATASAAQTVAIGRGATANNQESVALGLGTETNASHQIAVGARDVEIQASGTRGLILRDTNGARYRITVNTSGELVVTPL